MRRGTAVASVLISVALTVGLWVSPVAAAKGGARCQDAGAVAVIKDVTFQCATLNKKLKWVAIEDESIAPIETAATPITITITITPSTITTTPSTTTTTLPANPPSPWIVDMLTMVNLERKAAGLGSVVECSALNQSALAHSQDMYTRDFFSHTNPDDESPSDRIRLTGYLNRSKSWRTGENIAKGFVDVVSVMAGWMKSPGHRANILNSNFTHLGFGIYSLRTDSIYDGYIWTQNFGSGGTC